jgi:quinol monooxygenase YgiN
MHKSIPTSYSVFYEKENPLYGEYATHIEIDDEAGGGFIILKQYTDDGTMKIKLDKDEMEEVFRLANKLLAAYDAVTKEQEK